MASIQQVALTITPVPNSTNVSVSMAMWFPQAIMI